MKAATIAASAPINAATNTAFSLIQFTIPVFSVGGVLAILMVSGLFAKESWNSKLSAVKFEMCKMNMRNTNNVITVLILLSRLSFRSKNKELGR